MKDWLEAEFDLDSGRWEAEYDDDDSSDPEDLTKVCLKAKEAVLSISKSIVSLASSIDGRPLFACTGTVVDLVGSKTWILTTATLVRKPNNDCEAYDGGDIKIEVLLHNRKVTEGCLAMCNLQYNIAVVTIESHMDLPMVTINDLPGYYPLLPSPVVAIGRDFESRDLLMRCGEMTRKSSKLDCNELVVCTCPVSKNFIGGPVMDFEKRIIGITFLDKAATPLLPIEIVTRCLNHFKKFGTFKQPWFCIRGRALHMLDLDKLEEICCKYPNLDSGILVEKISEALPGNCGGVEIGDIISQLDGVVLNSVAQFTGIFLNKVEVASNMQKTVILQAVVQRPKDYTTFVATLNVRELAPGECDISFNNRWTLPQW